MLGAWDDFDVLERELERRTSDFDPRTFGYASLRDLLVALKRPVVDQSHEVAARVRLKRKQPAQQPALKTAIAGGAGLSTSEGELVYSIDQGEGSS